MSKTCDPVGAFVSKKFPLASVMRGAIPPCYTSITKMERTR